MRLKGEYGLILAPAGFRLPGARREDGHGSAAPRSVDPTTEAVTLSLDLDQLLGALVREMGASRATRIVERLAGRPHREVYARALRLAQQDESLDAGRGA
jgi:hypothetical protein